MFFCEIKIEVAIKIKILHIVFLMAVLGSSCSHKKEEPKDILLRYGEKELTAAQVIERIPVGLLPIDSAALFHALVEEWVENNVISDFASERLLDLDEIDRRVDEYRRSLIVLEYLKKMRESQNPKIDEIQVREYYDRHRNELKLEVPLVKGIFMKINSDNQGKEQIKGLLSSDSPESIDRLEKEWLDRALEYNYFRDKWIDWETLRSMIPYRFGDGDEFLSETRYFETDYEDCSYYLKVYEYLPSGSEQPYEFASTWITGLLTRTNLEDYERKLVESLVKKSIKEKRLEPVGYDLASHELKDNIVIENNGKK